MLRLELRPSPSRLWALASPLLALLVTVALGVLLFTALPMFFLTGVPWPAEAMPEPLQLLRWLIPSTLGIQASLRLNQMGASLAQVWIYLAALGVQLAISLLLLGLLARLRRA